MMEVNEIKESKEEKENKRKKRYIIIILLILLLMGVTVGFASLTTSLNINGISHIKHITIWDIHFENIQVTDGSVVATVKPKIDSTKTIINYAVDLSSPGDFYEFTVDVCNSGEIDAKLDDLPILKGVSKEQESYVEYTINHADGSPIIVGEVIEVGESTKFQVRIAIKSDVTHEQMPTENQVLDLSVDIPYEQA